MFYARFVPNMSILLTSLYKLLEKGARWTWGEAQDAVFQKAKKPLSSAKVLTHFDPAKELRLECDTSPYGIKAVLFHRESGEDKPIGFRSRTLSTAERNYSQLEREALALVFGVAKFRDYLFGHEFTLVMDHQPLVGLLRSDRPTPAMAAARFQRWALLLGSYRYKLQYKPGQEMINADALSRLPVPAVATAAAETAAEGELPEYVLAMEQLEDGFVTTRKLKQMRATDSVLEQVKNYIING